MFSTGSDPTGYASFMQTINGLLFLSHIDYELVDVICQPPGK